jgi:Arc/MetJ-type ribon-helix-helix transcriptional regulator
MPRPSPIFCCRAADNNEEQEKATMKGKNGERVMQLNLPPDLETLINKRLSSGAYTNVEDVLRRALEAQDAEESWTDEERRALSAHIEEGYQQAERGQLINGAQARREIQAMKEKWRKGRSSGR